MCPTRSWVCRTALIRSALESPDLGAFNDGSNVEIRPLGTDLITFEVAFWRDFYQLTSNFVPIWTFENSLDQLKLLDFEPLDRLDVRIVLPTLS